MPGLVFGVRDEVNFSIWKEEHVLNWSVGEGQTPGRGQRVIHHQEQQHEAAQAKRMQDGTTEDPVADDSLHRSECIRQDRSTGDLDIQCLKSLHVPLVSLHHGADPVLVKPSHSVHPQVAVQRYGAVGGPGDGVQADNIQPRFSQTQVDEVDLHQAGGEAVCVNQPVGLHQVQVLEEFEVDEGSSVEPPHGPHDAGDAPEGSREGPSQEAWQDRAVLDDQYEYHLQDVLNTEEEAGMQHTERVQVELGAMPDDEKVEIINEMKSTRLSVPVLACGQHQHLPHQPAVGGQEIHGDGTEPRVDAERLEMFPEIKIVLKRITITNIREDEEVFLDVPDVYVMLSKASTTRGFIIHPVSSLTFTQSNDKTTASEEENCPEQVGVEMSQEFEEQKIIPDLVAAHGDPRVGTHVHTQAGARVVLGDSPGDGPQCEEEAGAAHGGPFKGKLVAVQNLAIYSAEEQAFDKNRLMGQAEDEIALPVDASLVEVATVMRENRMASSSSSAKSVAPYTRKGPFTEKLISTQSLALFYSKQIADKSRLNKDGGGAIEVDMMNPDSQERNPTCLNEAVEEHPVRIQSMMMLKLQQKPMMGSLGKNLRERQSIEVKENTNFPDDEAMKVTKLEEFDMDSRVESIFDVNRDSQLMPQDVEISMGRSPKKVMNIDPELTDAASALPSSTGLEEPLRGAPTERLRMKLITQALNYTGPEKVNRVEIRLNDTAPALPYRSGLGVSSVEALGTSWTENSTAMRELGMASSSNAHTTITMPMGTSQVTSWSGREKSCSESLFMRRGQLREQGDDIIELRAAQHEQGLRDHLVQVPGGASYQGREEGHGVGQSGEKIRLYTGLKTGSGPDQLMFTNQKTVTTDLTGQVAQSSKQSFKHSSFRMFDLMKFFESGPRSQIHVINGVARRVTYGGSNMMALAELHGPQVLKLPSTWFILSPRWQKLLYLGRSNVMASWPFMEIRLGTTASVAPFELTDDDTLQPIVMIIPTEFVTPSLAQVVLEAFRRIKEKKETSFQLFDKSVHCRLMGIGRQAFTDLVEKIHKQRVPVLFCRAVLSAATM